MSAPDYDALIAQLETALGSGEVTIEDDGSRVTYRGVDDIMKAIARLEARKAAAARAGRARSMTTVVAFEAD